MRKPSHRSLTQLVEKARAGDRAALRAALEDVEPRIAGIAFGICWNRELVSDAVQETLLKCVVGIGRLRDAAAFLAWVDKVATRTSVDVARAATRAEPLPEVPLASYGPDRVQAGGPDRAQSIAIRAAVAGLPPHHRAVIVLFYWLDKPISEIAETVGCEEGTVKSRLARAREALGSVLGEESHGRAY